MNRTNRANQTDEAKRMESYNQKSRTIHHQTSPGTKQKRNNNRTWTGANQKTETDEIKQKRKQELQQSRMIGILKKETRTKACTEMET